MVIEALEGNVIAQIRSSSAVDSVNQCVTELVLNSLDAKSTSIAIRVNLASFRIQVVDNGRGISRSNLESVGVRYMTNKCHSLEDLKRHLKYYGFKGEALASISKISSRVSITTREQNSEVTFSKIIENKGFRIETVNNRPTVGTTVTVEGFLNNLPVRQQCVKKSEFENIKKSLESLIIIHPRVSFTLRNDLGAILLLASVKCGDIASSLKTVHPEIDENNFALLKVSKNRINVDGLIYKQFHDTKKLQYIYVNKRPINCPKVQNFLNFLLKQSSKRNPVYVIHIKCPYSDVDINLEPTKTVVFFKKFDTIKRCIEKMITTYLGAGDVQPATEKTGARAAPSEFGVSQIGGAVKCYGTKRKSEEFHETVSNKSAKIIDDTPFFEEPKVPTKQTKMALPIEVKKSEKKECCDESLFTNFPDNEERGKNVIMDMFILSLKAFPADAPELPTDKISLKALDSVSEAQDKITMAIQTTLSEVVPTEKNMVSVGVQTSDPNFVFSPRKSLTKYVSDYDFDFSRLEAPKPNPNGKFWTELPFFVEARDKTKPIFDFRNINNPRKVQNGVQESPYFSRKTKPNLNRASPGNQKNFFSKNQIEMTFMKRGRKKRCLNDTTTSKFFTPKKKPQSLNDSEDLFQQNSTVQDDLVITMGEENVKENLMDKSDWIKEVNDFGTTIYTNRKTGLKTLSSPKRDVSFQMAERFDFVPKGLSPILKDYGQVHPLSSQGKEQLQNAIIQSYEDDLLLIKWQNYIDNKDPKKFFEDIYLEKSKLIESSIPNINKSSNKGIKGFENMSFTKSLFENLEIVGQVDCKFIAAIEKNKKLILLFDQHAVHERVRLEELSEGYKNASTRLDQNITIFLPHNDLSLLKRQKTNLSALGLVLDFFTNGITIHQVPLCIYNKSKKGVDILALTEALIKEIVGTLTSNGVLVNTPRIIQGIVNSEACRGAIMFGDPLSKNECTVHLKRLAQCTLPFQCAHGRPTLTPLLTLDKFYEPVVDKPRLSNLQ